MGIKLGVLNTFDNRGRDCYIAACKELGVDYEVVDILASDWVERVSNSSCDGFLARPPCDLPVRKAVYDERLYFLSNVLKRPIYPGFEELFIYENKRNMASWLQIHRFPHPKTEVFCRKADAIEYLDKCTYPVVFKANTGASARQVRIVKDRFEAKTIIHQIFGLVHPSLSLGYVGFKFKGVPLPLPGVSQKHVVLIQSYSKIRWEWRVIRIGESYFGHQKLLKGQFASGSGKVGWVRPPDELLHMVRDLCDKGGFRSMAVDIFELEDGSYQINELQSIFGSYNNSQMYIDGKPGRLLLQDDDSFKFEEGYFNTHGSYLLRVKDFLAVLKDKGV